MRLPLKLATPRSMTRSCVGCLPGSGGGSSKMRSKTLQLTAPIPKAPSRTARIARRQSTELTDEERRLTECIVAPSGPETKSLCGPLAEVEPADPGIVVVHVYPQL